MNSIETQYLSVLRQLVESNIAWKQNRTGIKTKTMLNVQLKHDDLESSFPLLTSKSVFFNGVAHELLWFLSGSTNTAYLTENGVRVWDGNTSRSYLDSVGLSKYPVGELGTGYGFQWRNFNGVYPDNQKHSGVDQIAQIINMIRADPDADGANARRLVLTCWNPNQLESAALVPCHLLYIFRVLDGKLHVKMIMRSGDFFLGVPFNIASTALLTCMLAQVTGLRPGSLCVDIFDAHLYESHLEAASMQLTKQVHASPKLQLNPDCREIDDFKRVDIRIVDYISSGSIKVTMAV